jgi:hypothetical protein
MTRLNVSGMVWVVVQCGCAGTNGPPAASGPKPTRETQDHPQPAGEQIEAMREVRFHQMRDKGLHVQVMAIQHYQAGQIDLAINVLQEHLVHLGASDLEPEWMLLLRRPVESRLEQFLRLKDKKD